MSQTAASSHTNLFMSPLAHSASRLWRNLPRHDDGGSDYEQTQPGKRLQHSGKAAAFIEPGDEADGSAGGREADEIAHRICARAPLLRCVLTDQSVIHS